MRFVRGVLNRIAHLVGVMLFVSAVTFSLTNLLPGTMAEAMLGDQASKEDLARLERQIGLDRPLSERFGKWLTSAVQGDLGRSFATSEEIGPAVAHRLPVSIELVILSQLIALMLAVPLGVLAGYREGRLVDRILSSGAFATLALPHFVSGIILIYIFAIQLRWLPATGYQPPSSGLLQNLRSMLLPSLTLALVEAPAYLRIIRSDLATTLREDFVMVARAKGLPNWRILLTHALRPSSLGLVTVMGINVGHLIGGAIVIETLFALPGVGSMLMESISRRDYLAVQGVVLVVSVGFVAVNIVVDLLYVILDPRTRHHARR
jgi:peptide/nickel transport system permease protein